MRGWGTFEMSEMILNSGLFTGKPTREFVCFNEVEVEVSKGRRRFAEEKLAERLRAGDAVGDEELPELVEPQGAYFDLMPVTGDLDADYVKRRGQDRHNLKLRPKEKGEDGPNVRFEAMEISISNEQEIAALQWLAKKVVKGWSGIKLDDGTDLEFSSNNLEKLASLPLVIRPVIQKAYELGQIRDTFSAGN
jgi:hypothetical protein